jgi:hypothetical protein
MCDYNIFNGLILICYFIQIVSITLVTIAGILLLLNMLPDREFKTYTDNELRSEALSRRMKPIPKTIEGLLML